MAFPMSPTSSPARPTRSRRSTSVRWNFSPRNLTVRLIYASPKVGDYWRRLIPRQRVRFWAVEREVMAGWRAQVKPDADPASQDRLWRWVQDNVDYRVRAGGL